jgi:predicted Rossmann fold nucleotide-binding protein DprA/Smf involved in DNA uptake
MKKIPVNVRVLRAVATTMPKGAKVRDIVKITGMPNQSVSNCLWKLKDEGKINRDDGFYKINDNVLTDVNKPVEKAPALEANKETTTLTIGKVARKLAQENERLKQEVNKWEKEWRYARESSLEFERKYFDALAVIKYLEDK